MTDLSIDDADIVSQGNRLQGKTAIVTGGCSGIGLAIAEKLVQAGVKVLVGDVQPMNREVDGVLWQKTDASSWEELMLLFKFAIQQWGRIDIVIPNAGIGDKGDFYDQTDEHGDPVKPAFQCLHVTLIGQMYTVKLALHYMRRQQPQGGVIVSTVSRAGYVAESIPTYGVAKHGMIGLMRALRPISNSWNVRINSMAPGITDTPALRSIPGLMPKLYDAKLPISSSEECARATVYMCASDEYHGKTILVNGGKYREVESGYNHHLRDILGDDKRLELSREDKTVMNDIFAPAEKF